MFTYRGRGSYLSGNTNGKYQVRDRWRNVFKIAGGNAKAGSVKTMSTTSFQMVVKNV